MISVKIKDYGVFKLLERSARVTRQAPARWLHYHAQSLMGAISSATNDPNRTLAADVEADVMAHLTGAKTPKGLIIRASARKRAEALMGEYQRDMDNESNEAYIRLKALKRLRQRNKIRKSDYIRQWQSLQTKMYGPQALRNRLMLRTNARGNLRRDAEGRGYLTNTATNLQTKRRLNVSAIAARNELKQRRKSGGALHASFAIFYKKLRGIALGKALQGTCNFNAGTTWRYSFNYTHGIEPKMVLTLENGAFRDNKPVALVEAGFKLESQNLKKHLAEKASEDYRKK